MYTQYTCINVRQPKKPSKHQHFQSKIPLRCSSDSNLTHPSPTTTHLMACILPDALKFRENFELQKTFATSVSPTPDLTALPQGILGYLQ